jgi:hypothetical protein
MSPLVFLTPLWFVLEILHLVASERFLGVKQIEAGTDPRTLGPKEGFAALWSISILSYWLWLVLMLLQPLGRPQVAALIAVSVIGFSIRRNCSLKWVLVALTFEGAIRVGMLLSLAAVAWRHL